MMWWFKVAMASAAGWVIGFFAVCVAFAGIFAAVLWLSENAHSQESAAIATYPAYLGERDHRLNRGTEQPNYGSPSSIAQYIDSGYLDDLYGAANMERTCRDHNTYLLYMLKDVAKWIAKHPDLGYMLKGSIQGIHDKWCRL